MPLSRQQIRERKRHLENEQRQKKSVQERLADLNEADRLNQQRKSTKDQMVLQTGSLCVAILSQIPEKRDGVGKVPPKATLYLETLLDMAYENLTATEDEDEPNFEDDEGDDEEDEEPALA